MYRLKLLFNLLTIFSPFLVLAQENLIIEGKIETNTKSTLAYVNIGVIGTSTGTVSAPDGTFQLYLKEGINEEQIVRFSYIGYQSKDFTIASLRLLKNSIILDPTAIDLQTVEVLPDFKQAKWIGHKKTKAITVTNLAISNKPNQNLGAAIGRKFRLGKKTTQLKQFRFFLSYNDFDAVRFRVSIYTIKNGKPGELLNTQEILTELLPQQREWITVDLSPYKIIAKGKIVVAIDWVYHSEKGKYLQLPLTIPAIGASHYYRFGSQNKWKRFRGMSTAMELEIETQ